MESKVINKEIEIERQINKSPTKQRFFMITRGGLAALFAGWLFQNQGTQAHTYLRAVFRQSIQFLAYCESELELNF